MAAVVALRALGLGDLLTAVPALRGLRRAFPHHRLVLAGPAALAPLARASGAVDEVADVAAAVGGGPARLDVPDVLRGAEVAVNLHGAGPQSTAALAALRPSRLVAFGHGDAPPYPEDVHERVRWCRLLAAHGIDADPDDLLLDPPREGEADEHPATCPAQGSPGAGEEDRARDPCDAGRPGAVVVLHPGAASPARRWPAARWAAVARSLRAAGRDVLLTGGPDERGLALGVARRAGLPGAAVLAGRTGLDDLCRTVARAACVVSGDTGVAHLAVAYARPTVTLFGPVDPALWGPPAHPRHRVLWDGRTGDPHAAVPDPGLLAITPDDLLREIGAARRPVGPQSPHEGVEGPPVASGVRAR